MLYSHTEVTIRSP